MKNKTLYRTTTSGGSSPLLRILWCELLTLLVLLCTQKTQAASQAWTNAPTDATWTNILNWNSGAVPGADNMTGNTVNNDVVTFTNPIPVAGIGTVARPILVDDATISGDRSRQIGGITFDGTNCGAYVFSGTQPMLYPSTGILYVSQTNSILMTPVVTNSQTFIVPVFTRLPSSTAGIFTLINNATSSSATMFFTAVTNDSANTRGTVFTLDGTN